MRWLFSQKSGHTGWRSATLEHLEEQKETGIVSLVEQVDLLIVVTRQVAMGVVDNIRQEISNLEVVHSSLGVLVNT